jgi:hypothetical protein
VPSGPAQRGTTAERLESVSRPGAAGPATADLEAVPLRYQPLAEAYFRRLAEETNR